MTRRLRFLVGYLIDVTSAATRMVFVFIAILAAMPISPAVTR